MQKIDFVSNLSDIIKSLKSQEIVNVFESSLKTPGQPYPFDKINPILFSSKSNYDKIKIKKEYQGILNSLYSDVVYSENNLAQLTTILRGISLRDLFMNQKAIELYNFHNNLISLHSLSSDILMPESLLSTKDNDVLLFRVVIENEGLDPQTYINILTAINELSQIVTKIVTQSEVKTEIVLLDSGSDTNIGVKNGIETTKSLFLIFKEVWEFITQFRFYQNKKKNDTLIESLTIRKQIMEMQKEGIISEDEAKEYVHKIKTRTAALIGMKVLPKEILLEGNIEDNLKLLENAKELPLLNMGDAVEAKSDNGDSN